MFIPETSFHCDPNVSPQGVYGNYPPTKTDIPLGLCGLDRYVKSSLSNYCL